MELGTRIGEGKECGSGEGEEVERGGKRNTWSGGGKGVMIKI